MSDSLFSGSVSMSSEVLVQRLPDDELIFLNLASEEYFGLDATGATMYDALVETRSVPEAYDRLLGEFDVEPEILRRDLSSLVEKLVSKGLFTRESG